MRSSIDEDQQRLIKAGFGLQESCNERNSQVLDTLSVTPKVAKLQTLYKNIIPYYYYILYCRYGSPKIATSSVFSRGTLTGPTFEAVANGATWFHSMQLFKTKTCKPLLGLTLRGCTSKNQKPTS